MTVETITPVCGLRPITAYGIRNAQHVTSSFILPTTALHIDKPPCTALSKMAISDFSMARQFLHLTIFLLVYSASTSTVTGRKPGNLTLGYLPALKGDAQYLQGFVISGAISYAIDQINNDSYLLPNHHLNLIWADTHADSFHGTRELTQLWKDGAVAFFGPEDECEKEAFVAAAWDLPMISYVCSTYLIYSL